MLSATRAGPPRDPYQFLAPTAPTPSRSALRVKGQRSPARQLTALRSEPAWFQEHGPSLANPAVASTKSRLPISRGKSSFWSSLSWDRAHVRSPYPITHTDGTRTLWA